MSSKRCSCRASLQEHLGLGRGRLRLVERFLRGLCVARGGDPALVRRLGLRARHLECLLKRAHHRLGRRDRRFERVRFAQFLGDPAGELRSSGGLPGQVVRLVPLSLPGGHQVRLGRRKRLLGRGQQPIGIGDGRRGLGELPGSWTRTPAPQSPPARSSDRAGSCPAAQPASHAPSPRPPPPWRAPLGARPAGREPPRGGLAPRPASRRPPRPRREPAPDAPPTRTRGRVDRRQDSSPAWPLDRPATRTRAPRVRC